MFPLLPEELKNILQLSFQHFPEAVNVQHVVAG